MEFTLSGNALKTLARSITCLSRVGTDLVIQASPSQAVCSVLRTPISNIDYLSVHLPDINASKVQWALQCFSGIKKTYWITCNVGPDIQQLSLDRRKYPSNFVVRPHDLNRLLVNFQSSLQEITIIATECDSDPSDAASEFEKNIMVQILAAENDSLLHTQLWIDPAEDFVQYAHNGNPVDVTFAFKELKATMLTSQLHEANIGPSANECRARLILGKLLENSQNNCSRDSIKSYQNIV